MAIEGELVLRVDWDAGHVTRAEAQTLRPRIAGKVLPGRKPEEAVALVQNLFAICGRAQGVAAAAATDAASAREPSAALVAARERRIVAETAHEHFWRVLIDWPRLAGRDAQAAAMGAIRKALAPWLNAGVGEAAAPVSELAAAARQWVFGRDAGDWLAMSALDEARVWWDAGTTTAARAVADLMRSGPGLGASEVAPMEPIDESRLVEILEPALRAQDDFDALPDWQGEPRETGALARVASHPLVAAAIARWGRGVGARALARLVELAQLVQVLSGKSQDGPRSGASCLPGGAGISWVETARGLLVHRAEVGNGRIAAYRIVAPTEWNFHPRGAFVRGALGLAPDTREDLERDASRIVASLDPCVAWRVEVGHA
jgi:uptake hydrogenase large subunit